MPKLLPATKDVTTSTAIGSGDGCAPRASVVKFQDEIAFNNGSVRVLIHRLIDQGEFRSVYLARDIKTCQLYALKKVACITAISDTDEEQEEEQCRKEVAIHQLFDNHENIMPLIGVEFVHEQQQSPCCYMLFPYLPRSLGNDSKYIKIVTGILARVAP